MGYKNRANPSVEEGTPSHGGGECGQIRFGWQPLGLGFWGNNGSHLADETMME